MAVPSRSRWIPCPRRRPGRTTKPAWRSARIRHMFQREREKAAAERAAAARQALAREANCATAREQLQSLTRASAIYQVDENGKRVYFSAQRRADEIQQARTAVDAWCP